MCICTIDVYEFPLMFEAIDEMHIYIVSFCDVDLLLKILC